MVSETKGRTIGSVLRQNRGVGPGFHFLRHALSFGIVLLHCRTAAYWVTTSALTAAGLKVGYKVGAMPSFSAIDLLRPMIVALVATFFALSGFLVAGSALRTKKISSFFINRALRIVPALSVEVTLSALILGPIFTTWALSDYFTSGVTLRYLGNIAGHITYDLPGVFKNLPWTSKVNGSLWTLPWEFWCYALMMGVLLLNLVKRPRFLSSTVMVVLIAVTVGNIIRPDVFMVRGPNFIMGWYLVFMFWVGVVFYLLAERIPLRLDLFLVSGALYYLSVLFNVLVPLAAVPLAYCMAYVGMTRFPLWDRLVRSDYSYGIYLYAFPIMQAWIAVTLNVLPHWSPFRQTIALFGLTMVTTVAFAAFSWRYIEEPALRLRKVFLPNSSGAAKAAPETPIEKARFGEIGNVPDPAKT